MILTGTFIFMCSSIPFSGKTEHTQIIEAHLMAHENTQIGAQIVGVSKAS